MLRHDGVSRQCPLRHTAPTHAGEAHVPTQILARRAGAACCGNVICRSGRRRSRPGNPRHAGRAGGSRAGRPASARRSANASIAASRRRPRCGAPPMAMATPGPPSCARTSPATRPRVDALFTRYQHNLEMIWGHTQEIRRELNTPADLDTGPVAPFDEIFAAWNPSAHVLDDLFDNKLAFVALLNFPLTSLRRARDAGRRLDPPPMGRDPPGRNLPPAGARRGQPGGVRCLCRLRPVHRRLQHLDAPPGRCARAAACSPPASDCSRTGTCATSSRPTTPTRRTASPSSAPSRR